MTLKQCYEAFGGAYDEVLARLGGMEKLIVKLLLKYPNDVTCDQMNRAMDAGDAAEAFRAVHTLKGLALNLGFSRLAEAASALSEALRPGTEPTPALSELNDLRAAVNRCNVEVLDAIARMD